MPTKWLLESPNRMTLIREPLISYNEAKRMQHRAAKRGRELEEAGNAKAAFFEFAQASRMHQLAYEISIEKGIHKPKDLSESIAIAMATRDGHYPPAPRDPYAKDMERLRPAVFKVPKRSQ